MAIAIEAGQVKLNDGSVVQAQQGAWYDGQQFFNGSLSQPGQIHPQSPQQGAGDLVSPEVNVQSDIAQGQAPGTIQNFLQTQRQNAGLPQSASPSQPGFTPTFTDGAGDGGAGVPSFSAPPALNLPELHQQLVDGSDIKGIQEELSEKEKAFTEAKGIVNDNPFLSEGDRTGRVEKITRLFDERTANLRSDIATKTADIETKLNLELKQLDLNSQQTQLAWQQFNTLLTSGALNNASGDSIAQITRSTGIGSDLIRSAIAANNKKDVKSTVIQSTADSGEVTVSVIDSETGNVIKQSSLGFIGNKQTGGSSKATQAEELQIIKSDFVNQVRSGIGVTDAFRLAGSFLDANEILRLYNTNSPHGFAKESKSELRAFGVDSEDLLKGK